MRIAVIGGTGVVGHHTVQALRRAGHAAVVVARARGVDVSTGKGLDEALVGVDTVVDVTNLQAPDAEGTRNLFAAVTRNLLAAEQRAKVKHHVVLSIVGVDRIEGNPHYAGKRLQEELVSSGAVPYTIQRATQFHEFAGMVVSWTRQGDVATVPPILVQPVAAADAAAVLAEIATGAPRGRAVDLAGPEPQDLVDMARRTLAARNESIRLIPSWRTGVFGLDAAGEVLLAGPEARLAHRPDELSGGEMQRVALARALVLDPVLLLADEPTGNLDSKTGEATLSLIRQANAEWHQTVIMVTHDQRAAGFGKRVLTVQDGRVVARPSPAESSARLTCLSGGSVS